MNRTVSTIAAIALAAGLGIGTTTEAQAAPSGRGFCSTGKGVLRAGDYWSPNGRTTLHQVYPTRVGMVKGGTTAKWKYELYSIKVSNGAKVSYGTNAWLFQTPRNKKVNVTITWRADHPFTLGTQWRYASCTIKNVG